LSEEDDNTKQRRPRKIVNITWRVQFIQKERKKIQIQFMLGFKKTKKMTQYKQELTRDELTRAMNLMKKLSCNMFQHFLAVASAMFSFSPLHFNYWWDVV
jgi:hypothetical protein